MRSKFRFLPSVVGSYSFCSIRHASNGFFRELATVSFASYLLRAMCSTFVEVGKELCRDFLDMFSRPLQHHLGRLRLLRPLL